MNKRLELRSRIKKLPDDVQEAIDSVDDVDILLAIKEKYNLHFDQMGDLGNEIFKIFIGDTVPQEFIKNLQKRLNIPIETAQAIGAEVNEKIFKPVRESLKKIHQMDTQKEKNEMKVEVTQSPKPLDLKNKLEKTPEAAVPEEIAPKPAPDRYREPVE